MEKKILIISIIFIVALSLLTQVTIFAQEKSSIENEATIVYVPNTPTKTTTNKIEIPRQAKQKGKYYLLFLFSLLLLTIALFIIVNKKT